MNLWFEITDIADPADDERTEWEFKEMVGEIRQVLNKYYWDLEGYIPTPASQLAVWYGAGQPEDNSFPGIEHYVHDKYMPVDDES